MLVPFMLLLLSLAGVFVAFALPGWSDLIMVAGPAALASLYLLLRARPARQDRTAWVILDGSNVMHWHDGTPNLATVREVLDLAEAVVLSGREGEIFDAVVVDEGEWGVEVQISDPAVLVRTSARRVDPGDDLRVRLVSADPEHRTVDFERVS